MAGKLCTSLVDFENLTQQKKNQLEQKLRRRQAYLEVHLADVNDALKLLESEWRRKKGRKKSSGRGPRRGK
jgi:hypothetical protein